MSTEMVARTGNEAMAEAMRQINPDVVAAYPITPATEVVQIFAGFQADGLVDTEFVTVESEHSAMSACIGASQAGSRVMTATSSQGLMLMAEELFIASGLRLPIVMAEVNRAISAPLNIHCDHSDTMAVRDSGWVQIFSENGQEAYDNMIQAVRIAEHPDVRLPVMVTTDGFIISHGLEGVELLPDDAVREFIGEYVSRYPLLDTDHPVTIGALAFTDVYFEARRQIAQAVETSKQVIAEAGWDFAKRFGRSYQFFDAHRLEDAEIAVLALGSTAGTARAVVDELRARGVRAGSVKLRVFRPFPAAELAESLRHLQALAVLDRSDALSACGGPVYTEVRSALLDLPRKPRVINYIYGLGGRDIKPAHIEKTFVQLQAIAKGAEPEQDVGYLGLREEELPLPHAERRMDPVHPGASLEG